MTVDEIHRNLLQALAVMVENYAAVLGNPIPGHEPVLREMALRHLQAQVRAAEIMCVAGGIDRATIETVMRLKYLSMGATVPA